MTEEPTTVVVAENGQNFLLSKALLDTATKLGLDPHCVVWRPREGGFEVPEAVAVAYAQDTGILSPADESKDSVRVEPKKATRGRPPKAVADLRKKEGGGGDA